MWWDVAAAPGMGEGLRVPPVQGSALRDCKTFFTTLAKKQEFHNQLWSRCKKKYSLLIFFLCHLTHIPESHQCHSLQ